MTIADEARDAAYAQGYADGKDKVYRDHDQIIEAADYHADDCPCRACRAMREVCDRLKRRILGQARTEIVESLYRAAAGEVDDSDVGELARGLIDDFAVNSDATVSAVLQDVMVEKSTQELALRIDTIGRELTAIGRAMRKAVFLASAEQVRSRNRGRAAEIERLLEQLREALKYGSTSAN